MTSPEEFRSVSNEALLVKLEAHERNAHHANLIIGCLVKRLGHVLADGQGHAYQVIIPDEEIVALEGGLEVTRSDGAAAVVLTLHAPKPHVVEATTTEGT